jgi:hypothetical protein
MNAKKTAKTSSPTTVDYSVPQSMCVDECEEDSEDFFVDVREVHGRFIGPASIELLPKVK